MKLRYLSLALLALLAMASASDVSAQDAAKGAALLASARQVIGGQNRLSGVKTFQMTGTFRRVIGTNDTEGDFDIFLELPDKYLRSEKTGTPGQPSTETIEALVGAEPRDVVRGGAGRGGRGGGNVGGGGDAPAGGDAAPPADGGDAVAGGAGDGAQPAGATPAPGRGRGFGVDPDVQRRARQADVGRLMLMLLLKSDVPVTWVGIAESPDGKADVLEARFADGQPTRLFLDITSHMPLMLQWQSVPALAGGRRGGQRGGRGQGQPGAVAAEPITNDMTFSDHREVNGIRLPYIITKGTNGQTFERWTVTRYRVNPSFNAETFTK